MYFLRGLKDKELREERAAGESQRRLLYAHPTQQLALVHAPRLTDHPRANVVPVYWSSLLCPDSSQVLFASVEFSLSPTDLRPLPRNLPSQCRLYANNDVVHVRLIMKRPRKPAPFRTSFPRHGNDLASRIPRS